MPEHVIRLRGAWEWTDLDDSDPRPMRIALPTYFDFTTARRVRLSRRFGRPPMKDPAEELWLRLERVTGLDSMTINGATIALQASLPDPLEIALRELMERNLLVLEVSLPSRESPTSQFDSRWGEIALIVRTPAH
jgi:hypothetical protein